ncbi:MAG: hypothetical protein GY866_17345 [Proteobacteria bacterium]|nr:hypothetical protein [Pseudomonadota bacterium]
MSYFEEKLPSSANKVFSAREYNIEDAIAVCSLNPKLVEKLTSKFLSKIQTGPDIIEPKEMTVQDRKTLLFQYAFQALEDDALTKREEYTLEKCGVCGEKHTFGISMEDFRKTAKNKLCSQQPEVPTEFEGQRLKITPVYGVHAEQLEIHGNRLAGLEAKHGTDSDEYQTERLKRDLYTLLCQFTLVVEDEKELSQKEQAARDREWLHSQPESRFGELTGLIATKRREIDHGIDFGYLVDCPNSEEGRVAVLLPFRFEEFIPRI